VNLEGRLQRLRRTVHAPCPDELEWISQLAARLGVTVPPYASAVFEQISPSCYGGISFADVGERAPLRGYDNAPTHVEAPALPEPTANGGGLRLVAYKPLFSGAAVERTPELHFQMPNAEVQLSPGDAKARGIRNGQVVSVSSNGTTLELRARIARDLHAGVVRIAREHAGELHATVEVSAT
jgi:predicted molibdopterin-dependent oxidoreductase YjgC